MGKVWSITSVMYLFVIGFSLLGQVYPAYSDGNRQFVLSSLFWIILGILALIGEILYLV